MPDDVITSSANPRVRNLVALRRRRARESQGVTLLEGYEELSLALEAGVAPRALYYCPALMPASGQGLGLVEDVRARGSEVIELGRAAFERAAYREGPDGFLAVVDAVGHGVSALELPPNPLVLVCEQVEKPGNLGAMLRTADAAGVAAVIAASPVTDWGNPNLVRGSKGTVFSVPVASDPVDVVLGWLADHGIPLVATTPHTDVFHTDISYDGPLAIAVGSEKEGLSDAMLQAAAYRVKIPMVGRANSLNVATAAAVVVYEAVRQRR